MIRLPRPILSAVASLLIQKETQDNITMSVHGTYTCIRKYPMCRWNWNATRNVENPPANQKVHVMHIQ